MKIKKHFLLLLIILLGGIFLRLYHYNEWLFFKWDQARDAILLAPAIQEGPQNLPLLGPRATKIGEDYLRLGPAYYYIQYLTGVIFQSTEPYIFAYSDLFFSILTIILFYLFLRLYFSRKISLSATAMYTFSFLVIQYSRFAWNPNSIPFFTLLAFYGLLRFFDANQAKKKMGWLAVWALAYGLASQYHFFAFFTLTAVSFVFLGYYFFKKIRKDDFQGKIKTIFSKNSLLYLMVVFAILGFLYTPVIISELKTDFSNSKLFLQMFSASGRKDKTFGEKFLRNFREQGNNYTLITTGFRHRAKMKDDPLTVGLGLFIIFSGLLLIGRELILKRKKSFNEQNKNDGERNFLTLLNLWIILFFLITISASYQLRPRYFTVVFPVPFLIIAFWFHLIQEKKRQYFPIALTTVTILILGLNAYNLQKWFWEQTASQTKNFKTYRTLILKHRDGITLGQLERVADYLSKQKTATTLYYSTPTEYYLPFKYLFILRGDKNESNFKYVKSPIDLVGKKNIYLIDNHQTGKASKKIRPYLKEISRKQFGQVFVHKMQVINQKTLRQVATKEARKKMQLLQESPSSAKKNTERLFWRDLLKESDISPKK